jgi:1-deoxy-D-xylulose-5-phosphate synthase
MDEQELRNLMYTSSQEHNGPFVIRYPRGTGSMVDWQTPFESVEIGRGRRLRNGDDVALLSIGAIGTEVATAAEKLEIQGVSAAHYDMRFVKPLDEVLLHQVFSRFKDVITVEDGCVQGGMGSAVTEWAMEQGYASKVVRLGVPDRYIEHGTQAQLYAECGYDTEAIVAKAVDMVQARGAESADEGLRIA